MLDLNIERERYLYLTIKVIFKNGAIAQTTESVNLDMFNNRYNCEWIRFDKGVIPTEFARYCSSMRFQFYTRDIVADEKGYHIDIDKAEVRWDDDWEYMDDDTEEEQAKKQAVKDFMDSFEVAEIELTKAKDINKSFAYKYLI